MASTPDTYLQFQIAYKVSKRTRTFQSEVDANSLYSQSEYLHNNIGHRHEHCNATSISIIK